MVKEKAQGGPAHYLLTFTDLARANVLRVGRCAYAPVPHRMVAAAPPPAGSLGVSGSLCRLSRRTRASPTPWAAGWESSSETGPASESSTNRLRRRLSGRARRDARGSFDLPLELSGCCGVRMGVRPGVDGVQTGGSAFSSKPRHLELLILDSLHTGSLFFRSNGRSQRPRNVVQHRSSVLKDTQTTTCSGNRKLKSNSNVAPVSPSSFRP